MIIQHRAIITIEVDVETEFINDPETPDMPAYCSYRSEFNEKAVIKEVNNKLREFIEENHDSICPSHL